MNWPDRSTAAFYTALCSTTLWITGTLVGLHPDGALLGFSGTMWTIWVTSERSDRNQSKRKKRATPSKRP